MTNNVIVPSTFTIINPFAKRKKSKELEIPKEEKDDKRKTE